MPGFRDKGKVDMIIKVTCETLVLRAYTVLTVVYIKLHM